MLYRKLKIHWTFFRVIALLHWCHGPYARIFTWTISDKRLDAQCLKITQNVSLRFSKTRQNWPFLAFLIMYFLSSPVASLAMLNATSSLIFKHRIVYCKSINFRMDHRVLIRHLFFIELSFSWWFLNGKLPVVAGEKPWFRSPLRNLRKKPKLPSFNFKSSLQHELR